MDANKRPTVFSSTQAAEIRFDLQRHIADMTRLLAAYENPFICQTIQGAHFAAKDLLDTSRKMEEIHNASQLQSLTQVNGLLGPTVSSFDLGDITGSENECVADIRAEYKERLEASPVAANDSYPPSNTDHFDARNGSVQ